MEAVSQAEHDSCCPGNVRLGGILWGGFGNATVNIEIVSEGGLLLSGDFAGHFEVSGSGGLVFGGEGAAGFSQATDQGGIVLGGSNFQQRSQSGGIVLSGVVVANTDLGFHLEGGLLLSGEAFVAGGDLGAGFGGLVFSGEVLAVLDQLTSEGGLLLSGEAFVALGEEGAGQGGLVLGGEVFTFAPSPTPPLEGGFVLGGSSAFFIPP